MTTLPRPVTPSIDNEVVADSSSRLRTVAVENIAAFFNGGPENRKAALEAADENLKAWRESK